MKYQLSYKQLTDWVSKSDCFRVLESKSNKNCTREKDKIVAINSKWYKEGIIWCVSWFNGKFIILDINYDTANNRIFLNQRQNYYSVNDETEELDWKYFTFEELFNNLEVKVSDVKIGTIFVNWC